MAGAEPLNEEAVPNNEKIEGEARDVGDNGWIKKSDPNRNWKRFGEDKHLYLIWAQLLSLMLIYYDVLKNSIKSPVFGTNGRFVFGR